MQAQQQATAVRRYNKRILQMFRHSYSSSPRDSLDNQLSTVRSGVVTAGRKHRRGVPLDWIPLETQPTTVSLLGMRTVDPSVELALATNPLLGILAHTNGENDEDELAGSDVNLQLPDGSCLLSPFCLLENATQALRRPEKDAEDVEIPEVVLGMKTTHIVRRVFIAITMNGIFDKFMTAAITVSCGSMVFERPSLAEDSRMAQYLKTSNLVLTIIFGMFCFYSAHLMKVSCVVHLVLITVSCCNN